MYSVFSAYHNKLENFQGYRMEVQRFVTDLTTLLAMSSTPTEKEITNLWRAVAPVLSQTPSASDSRLRARPLVGMFHQFLRTCLIIQIYN